MGYTPEDEGYVRGPTAEEESAFKQWWEARQRLKDRGLLGSQQGEEDASRAAWNAALTLVTEAVVSAEVTVEDLKET